MSGEGLGGFRRQLEAVEMPLRCLGSASKVSGGLGGFRRQSEAVEVPFRCCGEGLGGFRRQL